jgi:hypothetical protein
VFLGNIHPLVRSWTSWCVVRAFGGDFGIVANYSRKKFLAPIHPSSRRFRSFTHAVHHVPHSSSWGHGIVCVRVFIYAVGRSTPAGGPAALSLVLPSDDELPAAADRVLYTTISCILAPPLLCLHLSRRHAPMEQSDSYQQRIDHTLTRAVTSRPVDHKRQQATSTAAQTTTPRRRIRSFGRSSTRRGTERYGWTERETEILRPRTNLCSG